MKEYDVVLYNMYNDEEREIETISARSAESAEKKAISGGLVNHQSGWGVLDSVEHIDNVYDYVLVNPDGHIRSFAPTLDTALMLFLKMPKQSKLYVEIENEEQMKLLKSK